MSGLRLFLCGDVMTGRGIDQILPHPSDPTIYESYLHDARDYIALAEEKNGQIARPVTLDYVWGESLAELRRSAVDARIVNLETSITTSDEAIPWKGIHYRMHPANVGCLTAADLDVCVLANNHVLDWGERGLLETLDVLAATKLRVAGAGTTADAAERPVRVPLDTGALLVAAVGHASSGIPLWWKASEQRPGVWLIEDLSPDTAAAIAERIARERARGDVTLVSIHWGPNWGYTVGESEVCFAHALVDAGVDIVHGHSSHHARPLEVYKGKLVLYGCGDFISDYEGIRGYEEYRGDLSPMYLPEIDPENGKLLRLRIVPLRLERMRLEHAPREDVHWLGDRLAEVSRPFGTRIQGTDAGLELRPTSTTVQVPSMR